MASFDRAVGHALKRRMTKEDAVDVEEMRTNYDVSLSLFSFKFDVVDENLD